MEDKELAWGSATSDCQNEKITTDFERIMECLTHEINRYHFLKNSINHLTNKIKQRPTEQCGETHDKKESQNKELSIVDKLNNEITIFKNLNNELSEIVDHAKTIC